MLDDFRQQANGSSFFDEEEEEEEESTIITTRPRRSQQKFLGMTAFQRFVLASLLLMLTCFLSTFCLLITERVVPPFMP